ncbi:hypothetical protein WJX82_004344 [Trebouxia sp. C0006]
MQQRQQGKATALSDTALSDFEDSDEDTTRQPTIARWLELAGPYLDSSSYIYHLLDQQQEQGEELHIQFFLAG